MYGIRENSISDWVKKKDEIYSRYASGECSSKQKYGNRSYKYDKVDKALFTWFSQQRTNNVPLSGPLCVEKANQFAKHLYGADAVISTSWFNRWKKRHGNILKTISGEDKSVQTELVSAWRETTLLTLLSQYALVDVYNADEFGLVFAAVPKTLLNIKGQQCSGGKLSKSRVTGLVCSNAIGDKLPLLIIGR